MVMIQIRNVPPDLHKRLKERASAEGMNLSDFLKKELERIISVPSTADIFAEIEADRRAGLLISTTREEIVEGIRKDRESH